MSHTPYAKPIPITFHYREEVERVASRHQLDPDMVQGICQVESGGNRHAWNPEPRYPYVWDVRLKTPFRKLTPAEAFASLPPKDFPTLAGDRDQEWWGQRASWGLMQIMGATARQYGFKELYLPQLVEAGYGIEYGVTYLKAMLQWSGGDHAKALGAYNAGYGGATGETGKAYAAKVFACTLEVKRGRVRTIGEDV